METQIVNKDSFKELILMLKNQGVNFKIKRFKKITELRFGLNKFQCNKAVISLSRKHESEEWIYKKGKINGVIVVDKH